MNATPVAIGVDNGGTWIRICVRARGKVLRNLKKPSPPLRDLPRYLRKHFAPYLNRVSLLVIGSKGVWGSSKKHALSKSLKGTTKRVIVVSDVEAAWLSAFKTGKPGIVLVAGTGSIAYGRRSNGTFARAGGLGPQKGDEGSGYWIGREWLQQRPTSNPAQVRKTAQHALDCLRKARRGHSRAAGIMREAAHHLSLLVKEAAHKLHMKGRLPLALHGSVLADPWFRLQFQKRMQQLGISYRRVPVRDVARALAFLKV